MATTQLDSNTHKHMHFGVVTSQLETLTLSRCLHLKEQHGASARRQHRFLEPAVEMTNHPLSRQGRPLEENDPYYCSYLRLPLRLVSNMVSRG